MIAGDLSAEDLIAMDFNSIVNMVGYEWLNDGNNPDAAIKVFQYGLELMPKDADLYDELMRCCSKLATYLAIGC